MPLVAGVRGRFSRNLAKRADLAKGDDDTELGDACSFVVCIQGGEEDGGVTFKNLVRLRTAKGAEYGIDPYVCS